MRRENTIMSNAEREVIETGHHNADYSPYGNGNLRVKAAGKHKLTHTVYCLVSFIQWHDAWYGHHGKQPS